MSRHFTAATGDYIDFSPGAIASSDGGPVSYAVLWRPSSSHDGTFTQGSNAGGYETWGYFPISDGYVWQSVGGSSRAVNPWTAGDGWRIDGFSKPDGAAQTVRGHYALLGGAWTHTDSSTCNDTTNGPAATIRVGNNNVASLPLNGDVAAIVFCGAVWTDETFETLASGLAAWDAAIAGDPAVLWAFNQSDVSDPVEDLTGGGGDQSAISGTSVADDPGGWSYNLASPVTAAAAGTLPAVAGTAAVTVANPVNAAAAGTLPAVTGTATATVANPTLQPNSELVAVEWLRTVTGLGAAMVATKLPADTSLWADDGFVTVGGGDGTGGGVIGGAPNRYLPLRNPVVSVHCWAVRPGSSRPPWGKAARLAELVVAGTYDETRMRRALTLPDGYYLARVNEAYPLTEPRRIPGDDSGFGHYQLDLQLHWVAIT